MGTLTGLALCLQLKYASLHPLHQLREPVDSLIGLALNLQLEHTSADLWPHFGILGSLISLTSFFLFSAPSDSPFNNIHEVFLLLVTPSCLSAYLWFGLPATFPAGHPSCVIFSHCTSAYSRHFLPHMLHIKLFSIILPGILLTGCHIFMCIRGVFFTRFPIHQLAFRMT